MQISIASNLPTRRIPDNNAFTLTANFLDESTDPWLPRVPVTVDYCIERVLRGNPQTFVELKAWTPLTPAESIAIEITAADNDIPDDHSEDEYRCITIRANAGLETEGRAIFNYCVQAQ
jgi:hypothetical protein